MSGNEFSPGLAGVVAFETEIAEPDRDGGQLRYRGVDIEELVGKVPFEQVWGLLVDESLEPGLPAAYAELEVRTGGHMSDLQSALAAFSGTWKLGQLIDIDVDALSPCSAVQIQYVSIAFACASFTSPRHASRNRSAAVFPSITFSSGTGGLSEPRAD